MGIGNQLLFFLAGLGVFNGLLLAFYFLFIVKPKRWVNILFGLLMLMLCIRIGKSVLHVFTDLDKIYLQIGLSACMMIGPIVFIYVRRFLSDLKRPRYSDWLHLFIPLLLIIGIGTVWPYESYPKAWNQHIVKSIYSVWFVYMMGTIVFLVPLLKKARKEKLTSGQQWILVVYSSVLLLCVLYILAYNGFPYLSAPILFSLVFYVLTGFLFSKNNRSSILYKEPDKYQNQKVSEAKADDLLQRMSDMMQSQESYLNHKLKLADIAASVDSTTHEVSQVINNKLGISFNQYINEFRIKAACELLKKSDHLTIEGIGKEVGFNSRSAFYSAFKSIMHQTPAQYKIQIKQFG